MSSRPTARVRVPATSANLGPGFDALGLALGLYDDVSATLLESGLRVHAEGEGSGDVPRDETHLIVRAMHRTFAALGAPAPGLAIECVSRIPHGRGLGSSAAAICAGVLLARALVPGAEQRLDAAGVLALAADLEGHPDNVAPCLLGGFTVAWCEDGGARAVRRDVDPHYVPVVIIPPFSASTAAARGLLPTAVPHADAAFTAGRAALLVAALSGEPDALFAATQDRLHQDYRRSAFPTSLDLVDALRARGHAAVVSGAGPTVLVLARGEVEAEAVIAQAPTEWRAMSLPIDAGGALAAVETSSAT